MKQNRFTAIPGRRRFLEQIGGLACLGCVTLFGQDQEKSEAAPHKFLVDSGMNVKEVLQFGTLVVYMPLMQRFADRFGKNKFLQILQEDTKAIWAERMQNAVQKVDAKTLGSFMEACRRCNCEIFPLHDPAVCNRFMDNSTTIEIVQQTDRVLEMKVSECLFAQVYREANAWDIGYITHCYPDYVLAGAFDPKMRLIRTKTLMRGDDRCNHRFIWDG